MSRRRVTRLTGAAVGLSVAVALAAPAQAATQQQRFFRGLLLEDRRTAPEIRTLLRSGGFVDDRVLFADLTGDRRDDAVVGVSTGGAAGTVAVYVFSTHGRDEGAELRALYRAQELYRASFAARRGSWTLTTPVYARGEPLCCPGKQLVRTLRWSESRSRFRATSREVPGPAQE